MIQKFHNELNILGLAAGSSVPKKQLSPSDTTISTSVGVYILDKKYLFHYFGLVARVSGYRYRGLGFDSRRYQIF